MARDDQFEIGVEGEFVSWKKENGKGLNEGDVGCLKQRISICGNVRGKSEENFNWQRYESCRETSGYR